MTPTSLGPFHHLWWDALGRHYELPGDIGLGECASCGDRALLHDRGGDGLCAPCFTISAKKAMASNPAKKAGPNGSHFIYASGDQFTYGGDLARPDGTAAHVEIRPASNALLRFSEFIRTPPTLPAYFVHMDRSYRPIIRRARPSLSARALHFNGVNASCADAPLINRAVSVLQEAFNGMPLPAHFNEIEQVAIPLMQGPLAGDAYQSARTTLSLIHQERAPLQRLYPSDGQWPIQPMTDNWEWLKAVCRYIRVGELT